MRRSEPSARNRAIIRGIEARGFHDVTEARLERWRGWRGVGLIERNRERWRDFANGRVVPEEEIERAVAVRRLCRHRRPLDEVALRLAFTHPVDPGALHRVRAERPKLWDRLAEETAAQTAATEPLRPVLEIRPPGHLILWYTGHARTEAPRPNQRGRAADRNGVDEWLLRTSAPAGIVIGAAEASSSRTSGHKAAGGCVNCDRPVYLLPIRELPEGTSVMCDYCAG